MDTENLFERFGAVLKDYIDDEDAQKRRYAKNTQDKAQSSQNSESEKQYERLLYMQSAHCRAAVFPRAEQQAENANDTSFAKKRAENPERLNTRPYFSSGFVHKAEKTQAVIYKAPPAGLLEDFKVLGFYTYADFPSCKKQYKKLLHTYHPDKYEAGGEEQKHAAELTQRLNRAFKNIEAWFLQNSRNI